MSDDDEWSPLPPAAASIIARERNRLGAIANRNSVVRSQRMSRIRRSFRSMREYEAELLRRQRIMFNNLVRYYPAYIGEHDMRDPREFVSRWMARAEVDPRVRNEMRREYDRMVAYLQSGGTLERRSLVFSSSAPFRRDEESMRHFAALRDERARLSYGPNLQDPYTGR